MAVTAAGEQAPDEQVLEGHQEPDDRPRGASGTRSERLALVTAMGGDHVRPLVLARESILAVGSPFDELIPEGGLRRGSTVAVGGHGCRSLALGLVAEASAAGSWVAAVGMADLGLRSAIELGVAVERLALVEPPPASAWTSVVATLAEGCDLVLLGPGHRIRTNDVRRLTARLRDRGAVLIQVGWPAGAWPERADVELTGTASRWVGLGEGHGYLRTRRLSIAVSGRRGSDQIRHADLLLPGSSGRTEAIPTGVPEIAADHDDRWSGSDLEQSAPWSDVAARPHVARAG